MSGPRPDILAIDHAAALAVNRRLYVALARRGLSVEIVTAESLWHLPGNRPAEPPADDDPPLHLLRFSGGNLRYVAIDGLAALMEQRRPRLVHLNNEPDTPLALRLGRRQHAAGGGLTALSLENVFAPFWASLLRRRLRPAARHLRTRATALLTRHAVDRVFCHSRAIERIWQRLGFAGRTRVIPLGFEPALFQPDAAARSTVRERLGLTQPTLAYVGRVTPQKGLDLLVEALGRLSAHPWQLLLPVGAAGGDDYARGLQQRLRHLGLAERVQYYDARHAEVPDYMRAADLVVVPSRWDEQYGRVAAEAMACGTAVIVTARGALPEIVGEAGLVVPSDDVAALTVAIDGLLRDPARREALGAAGAVRAAALLGVETQADLMAAEFRELLDGRPCA